MMMSDFDRLPTDDEATSAADRASALMMEDIETKADAKSFNDEPDTICVEYRDQSDGHLTYQGYGLHVDGPFLVIHLASDNRKHRAIYLPHADIASVIVNGNCGNEAVTP